MSRAAGRTAARGCGPRRRPPRSQSGFARAGGFDRRVEGEDVVWNAISSMVLMILEILPARGIDFVHREKQFIQPGIRVGNFTCRAAHLLRGRLRVLRVALGHGADFFARGRGLLRKRLLGRRNRARALGTECEIWVAAEVVLSAAWGEFVRRPWLRVAVIRRT